MAISHRAPEIALSGRFAGGITTSEFLTALLVTAGLVSLGPTIADAIARDGWALALARAFDIDAAVIVAFAIALKLSVGLGRGRPAQADFLMALVFGATLLLPHRAAGWLAIGVLGLYGTIAWRRAPDKWSVAFIALGISVHQAWGRGLLALFAPELTIWDASLAAHLLGGIGIPVFRFGNVLEVDPDVPLIVVASCLSGNVVLQGWLCGVAVRRHWWPEWRWQELQVWALATIVLAALNVIRLAACAASEDLYSLLHSPFPGNLFELLALCVAFFLYTRDIPNARPNAVPS